MLEDKAGINSVNGSEPGGFHALEREIERRRTGAYAALVAESAYRELDRARRRADLSLTATESRLQSLRPLLVGMRDRIEILQSSKFWKLRNRWFGWKRRFGKGPGRMADFPLPTVDELRRSDDSPYTVWRRLHDARQADIDRMRQVVPLLSLCPLISIIMPTYNTPHEFLRDAIDSVRNQAYENWELCVADDASTDPEIRQILGEYAFVDERIKVVERAENGHISRASNSALEVATGDFIALLDHDDEIARNALYDVVLEINKHPEADMIYSDEDKIDEYGVRSAPFFKPGWSPDTMLSKMYSCHLGVYRRSLVEAVGGFRPEYDGSQDWDLALRISERTEHIYHISKVLYSWRIHAASAASGTDAKPYAYDAAQRAIADALRRRGEPGTVSPVAGYPAGIFNVRYEIRGNPKVDIIIPTRDSADLLEACLESIFERTTYENFRITVVDNGSRKPETFELFKRFRRREPVRFNVELMDIPFNYPRLNNRAVAHTDGELLLFLNNDTAVIEPEWLEALVEQAQRPSIGAAGGLLLYEDDTIQHAGVILGIGGVAGHSHRHVPGDAAGHYNMLITTTNYAAVTAACLMVKRTDYERVGGFDERLAVAFNDVDLCLKLLELGRRNVYVPQARLYHFESRSRGYDVTPQKVELAKKERALFLDRWAKLVENDPYYNPHYTRVNESFGYRHLD
jgi:glycosyltransferase involved in cell wall biosynthesis